MHIRHPIPPFWDENSKILILGSFPSVKSRETMFFYGHPQNRFWRVLAAVLQKEAPQSIEEKKLFLKENHIALWDVIASCDITGSSDASIKNALPNDISAILGSADIKQIFVNGKTAEALYNRYIFPQCKISAVAMPSTSPANAAWSLEKLISKWSTVKQFLK